MERLDAMINAAKVHGAEYVMFSGLTLYGDNPSDCKTMYYQFLEDHFPELVSKYKKTFFRILCTFKALSKGSCRKVP
jgi:hypothetical protein